MGYADTLLASGETVVRRARQHWIVLFAGTPLGWLLVLAGIVGLLLSDTVRGGTTGGFQGTAADLTARAAAIVFIVGAALVVWHIVRWRAQDYLVTTRRVLMVDGVFNKRSLDTSLEKINDAVLDQSWLGRMLDFGDLDILTASEAAVDRFRTLQSAPAFKRTMLDQKHLLEVDIVRAGSGGDRLPGPGEGVGGAGGQAGGRAGAGGTAAGPAPAPEAAAASASAATPSAPPTGVVASIPEASRAGPATAGTGAEAPRDAVPAEAQQITDTLAKLADLRDRGAITESEYEAKKRELLSRL